MGSRENPFVDESIPKTAHQVGKESGKLSRNASLRMFMDNFQSCWTFRISSKSLSKEKIASKEIRVNATVPGFVDTKMIRKIQKILK